MRSPRSTLLLIAAIACGDPAPDPARDTTGSTAVDSPSATQPPRVSSGWDGRLGPVLLVAGERPSDVQVVFPELQGEAATDTLDAEAFVRAPASLLARRGVVATAGLQPSRDAEPDTYACVPWPVLSAPPGTPPWTVGFVGGGVTPIPLDSIHSMTARDSAALVAQIARVASVLPLNQTGESARTFRGLPFIVKDASRFVHDGAHGVVAHVVRRVNQEANPLEEHTLLIAERAGADGAWSAAHAERTTGPEDSVVRPEVLAAVRLGGQPVLVLALDGGEGVQYELLQRVEQARWRTVWRSARPQC